VSHTVVPCRLGNVSMDGPNLSHFPELALARAAAWLCKLRPQK